MIDVPARIGLTTYRERAGWTVWDEPADLLPATYADAVAATGAVPVLLPPVAVAVPGAVAAVLDGIDALVLAGGADVDPGRYGAERDPQTGPARPDRDDWETHLLHGALERGVPVLAICRGMQVLNVALGGTLVQHLPDHVGHDEHAPQPGVHGRHAVRVEPSSRLGSVVGPEVDVATYHHQAVDRLGSGLVACGWAQDGTVEAVELPSAGFALGVQWHPEVYEGALLFAALRERADAHRAARRDGAPG